MKSRRFQTKTVRLAGGVAAVAGACTLCFLAARRIAAQKQLIPAIDANNVQEVRACLAWGADPNSGRPGSGPAGFREMVRRMLHIGAPDRRETAYQHAIGGILRDQVKSSPGAHAEYNRRNAEIVSALLAYGADATGRTGWVEPATPLQDAVAWEDWPLVRVLLQHGARVSPWPPGENLRSMVWMAQDSDAPQDVMQLLRDHGGDAEAGHDTHGTSALPEETVPGKGASPPPGATVPDTVPLPPSSEH